MIYDFIFHKKNLKFNIFQIEKVIDDAIEEAQEIFESSLDNEESSTEALPSEDDKVQVVIEDEPIEEDFNSDEAFNDVITDDNIENGDETTETSQPSKDIDLGSVQEV